MKILVVASGSEGNATVFESRGTRVLVDAGIGPFALRRILDESGLSGGLDAVVITHAHQDHFGHALRYARKARVPVWITEGTARQLDLYGRRPERVSMYGARDAFAIGALTITPTPLPHDAPQVALVVSDGVRKAAIATDLGEVPPRLAEHIAGCDVLLIESNHEPEMLACGPYPESLKRRVASARGHLSNVQTHELLCRLASRTHTVVLMHLSRTNNRPDIALETARDALSGRRVRLLAAPTRDVLVVDADLPSFCPRLPGRRRAVLKVAYDQLSFWT